MHDTVVNQLLAKIDGVEQLNNILLIGKFTYTDQGGQLCSNLEQYFPEILHQKVLNHREEYKV